LVSVLKIVSKNLSGSPKKKEFRKLSRVLELGENKIQ
jgi:hypothetical protein